MLLKLRLLLSVSFSLSVLLYYFYPSTTFFLLVRVCVLFPLSLVTLTRYCWYSCCIHAFRTAFYEQYKLSIKLKRFKNHNTTTKKHTHENEQHPQKQYKLCNTKQQSESCAISSFSSHLHPIRSGVPVCSAVFVLCFRCCHFLSWLKVAYL